MCDPCLCHVCVCVCVCVCPHQSPPPYPPHTGVCSLPSRRPSIATLALQTTSWALLPVGHLSLSSSRVRIALRAHARTHSAPALTLALVCSGMLCVCAFLCIHAFASHAYALDTCIRTCHTHVPQVLLPSWWRLHTLCCGRTTSWIPCQACTRSRTTRRSWPCLRSPRFALLACVCV